MPSVSVSVWPIGSLLLVRLLPLLAQRTQNSNLYR